MTDHKWEVGEVVYLDGDYGAAGSLRKIERITPGGKIIVAGLMYGADGHKSGRDNFGSGMVRKLTPELQAKAEKAQIIRKIHVLRNNIGTPSGDFHNTDELKELLSVWQTVHRLTNRNVK